MNKDLYTNEKLLNDFTNLTNRSKNQTLFLFNLLDNDFDKLVLLEERIHHNFLHYCPVDKEECENVLKMDSKLDGVKDFTHFKDL